MSTSSSSELRDRIFQFLKRVAPYSIVEIGARTASSGGVTECSRTGSRIQGSVREISDGQEERTLSVKLEILSAQDISAECTCSSAEEMQEQWCSHAVSVLLRASDLGFSEADSGFAAQEALYRVATSTPQQIATTITELNNADPTPIITSSSIAPEVTIALDTSSDRLGVHVLFDGEEQMPSLFEGLRRPSPRELDNMLLRIIDEEGSWDDFTSQWFINSSRGIETVLGLLREYPRILSATDQQPIHFCDDALEARLYVEWQRGAAELMMNWVLTDGKERERVGEVLGTGPFWVMIDHTLHRLSPAAAKIAALFPHAPHLTVPRSQVGPVLAALSHSPSEVARSEAMVSGSIQRAHSPLISIRNPELQPESKIAAPVPTLELNRREQSDDHFSSNQRLLVQATLDFEYPVARGENIVYLPDVVAEQGCIDKLKALGFEMQGDRKRYSVGGDKALDFIHHGRASIPDEWRITGFEQLKKGLRFADLAITIALGEASTTNGAETDRRMKWFDCGVSLTQNNANVPLSTLFKNSRPDYDQWIRLDSGSYARVPGGGLNQLKTTLGMLDPNFKLSNTIKAKLTTAQAMSFARVEDEQIHLMLDAPLKQLARKLKDFSAITPVKIPKGFVGKLRPYQHEGLSWLNFLREFDLGGILADEMGLGKTIQALSLLLHVKESGEGKAKGKGPKPALIVAPTSVVMNWVYEIRKFTPKLKVLLLHGPRRREHFSSISEYDIVITSYALLRLDRTDLERHEYGYVILDEAQNIKNPVAATTRAAKAIKARHRLALTGTPTENRPLELWSIIDFLMPGYLGSMDFFRTYIEKPIMEGGPANEVAKFLNSKTRPFILRRLKSEVEKELPPKIESVLHVDMTDSQRDLYSQILNEVRPKVFDAIERKGVRGASVSILAALLRLRQVCNHPNSIDALKQVSGFDSGKFNLLKDVATEALENGKKVLLFSQFKEMLAIIRRWLEASGHQYLYLDGATRNRQELIDQFNADSKVRLFLISLKAGGTGLNLTAADTVIIYDPWWNPAVEGQAVDRAHRIGQTKTVNVYRLVTEQSIEQRIMDLKAKKARLVDALINETGLSTLSLSKNDLEHLFAPFPTQSEMGVDS